MDSLSDNEGRWIVAGICLTKVLTPVVRNVLGNEMQIWYHHLCKPPDEINKQVFTTFKKKLPPSRFLLQYKNINNNNVHKLPSAYDYAVKDALSLAKLFVQPFMAMFTGFNESMDMSAVLAVMCEADPFVTSGAATDAKTVRSDIRNKWAHCNFSDWTEPTFLAALQGMQSLAKNINLSSADAKALCDSLDDWKDKGTQLCFGQPVNSDLLKLVTEEVAELRTSVEKWIFQSDAEKNTVRERLNEMLCRIGEVEKLAADNSKGVKRHSKELEHHSNQLESHSSQLESHWKVLKHVTKKLKKEDDVKQEENYSQFAEKKAPYGLRNLPRQMVERRSEVDKVLGLLTKGNKVGVVGSLSGDVIGIRGMGGLGKTVLAQAVALVASKSRQVIWLDIGETPDRLALINILIKVLGGTVSFSDIPAAQSWIKADTSDKDCLVVLDDVWNVDDADVFHRLSGKCQLLITTRDVNVVHGLGGSAYELLTMTHDQSRALLYEYAGVTPDEQSKLSSNMQLIISKLLVQCRGLPLALSLVGSNLIHTRTEEDWQDILEDLECADLERLRSLFSTDAYPHRNLLAAIDVSFQRLEESAREKFLDFAIFPEDIDIPLDILELFWSSIGTDKQKIACNPRESRYILAVLESKSLIQKGPELQGKTSYRVHDLLLDFARAKLRASGTLTDVQCSFVKTLRGQCVNGEWNITSSTYYFKYLPYHIFSSEQHDELFQLFFDFQWLEQKMKLTDFPSLITDFRFLHTQPQEIELLKKSLMLSHYAIEKNPDSIGQQLLGGLLSYVDKYPCVNKLVKDIRDTCTKSCHILPLSSWLELEGPEVFTKNVDSPVLSLVTSNSSTGTIVISGLNNGLIKIHELETGKELKVLKKDRVAVQCLALSHSKTMLASSSFGQTILWEMNTYEQRFVLPAGNVVDFSVDDRRLYTGSYKGELLGDVCAHDIKITSLCTTKDGLYIATASEDNTIKLWRADTLVYETTLVGHTDAVMCVVATNVVNS